MALPQSPYEQDFGNAKIAISSGTGNTKDGIALCDELLMDIELPRYYRIKTLVLLASVSEEWRQREELRLRAEHVWNESRRLYPKGQNEQTDAVLEELRNLLDIFKTNQAKTVPSDYEDVLSAALAETEIEDLADIADGETETLADEEYARLKRVSGDGEQVVNPPKPSVVVDAETTENMLSKSSSNPSFAPASTLQTSRQALNHVRDGQTAGSRMIKRKSGITRRSAA